MVPALVMMVLLHAADEPLTPTPAAPAPPVEQPAPAPAPSTHADDNDDDDTDEEPRTVERGTVSTMSKPLAFVSEAGLTAASFIGLSIISTVVGLIPGISVFATFVSLTAPLTAGVVSWLVLTRLAKWRAPMLPVILGTALPVYATIVLNSVVIAAAAVAASVVLVIGAGYYFYVLVTSANIETWLVAAGAYYGAAAVAAAIMFSALALTFGTWLVAVGVGSVLGAVLGTALGRPMQHEDDTGYDIITVPEAGAKRARRHTEDVEKEDKSERPSSKIPENDTWGEDPPAPAPAPAPTY